MKILKKRGVVEKRGEEETKSMPHAPVIIIQYFNFILVDNEESHSAEIISWIRYLNLQRL